MSTDEEKDVKKYFRIVKIGLEKVRGSGFFLIGSDWLSSLLGQGRFITSFQAVCRVIIPHKLPVFLPKKI